MDCFLDGSMSLVFVVVLLVDDNDDDDDDLHHRLIPQCLCVYV